MVIRCRTHKTAYPEQLWMATPDDMPWVTGFGRTQLAAVKNLLSKLGVQF